MAVCNVKQKYALYNQRQQCYSILCLCKYFIPQNSSLWVHCITYFDVVAPPISSGNLQPILCISLAT